MHVFPSHFCKEHMKEAREGQPICSFPPCWAGILCWGQKRFSVKARMFQPWDLWEGSGGRAH